MGHMTIEDDKFLEMILRAVDLGLYSGKLDFVISSFGGMPEAAEKMCRTLRSFAGDLRVIIPKFAMSAATVLTFGADCILMSETSELGPIDPQFQFRSGNQVSAVPATDIISAYENLMEDFDNIPAGSQRIVMLAKVAEHIDPVMLAQAYRATEQAFLTAKDLLKLGLLKCHDEKMIEGTAEKFITHGQERSHATGIRAPQLIEWGFDCVTVEQIDSELWSKIWELYVRSEAHVQANSFMKYFVHRKAGLQIRAQVRPT
ncbi:MAG: hypothetical protein WBP42_08970 [Candidatus Zixiibacteriota bacterium]